MCSDTRCSGYAYEYGHGVSELPAGGTPIEGSTSYQEMPGSYPLDGIFELEQPDMQKPDFCYQYPNTQHSQAAPEHLQSYYKANQNAITRRPAPVPVPRLEVPETQNCVPRLMSDRYSITPSPISPITPVQDANAPPRQGVKSQLFLDTISPCAISPQAQVFPPYGLWGQFRQRSPATPSTINSYGSSNSATPLSAQLSPGQSSFYAWPQLQYGQLLPTYSQSHSPMAYNQNSIDASAAGSTSWQGDVKPQPPHRNNPLPMIGIQDLQSNSFEDLGHYALSPQTHIHHEPHTSTKTSQCANTQHSLAYNEAPPAYSPIVPDPQPTTNPQRRFAPAACQHCEKVFTGKYGPGNLKRHVRQAHGSIMDRARHICTSCMKTYNRADALRKHSWKKHRQETARPNKRRR